MKLLSIIIATYNRAAVLNTTLAEFKTLADEETEWELIIADNTGVMKLRISRIKFRISIKS